MKTVVVPSRARSLNGLLKQATQENLILRTADGREFILAEIDDFDREIELTRQNKEFMRLLDRRGEDRATLTSAEGRRRSGIG